MLRSLSVPVFAMMCVLVRVVPAAAGRPAAEGTRSARSASQAIHPTAPKGRAATSVPVVEPLVPTVEALTIQEGMRIDGRLVEEAWLRADVLRGFTQREPNEGQPESERTEVRVA